MKIYIVTKGEYSDYHICNVTTDYEKAKRYKEVYSDDWEEACIEVYKDEENGKENYCWTYNPNTNIVEMIDCCNPEQVYVSRWGTIAWVTVYAPNEKHAIKKAQDMIAKYKAEQVGL